MKEKLFGALLAMAPLAGNSQAEKPPLKDKVEPKIEATQEVQGDKRLKDKKTVHWNTVLETNVSLFSKKNNQNLELPEISAFNLKGGFENKNNKNPELEMPYLASSVFNDCVLVNSEQRNIDAMHNRGELGVSSSLWERYKAGEIKASEASTEARAGFLLSDKIKGLKIVDMGKNAMLANYFSKAAEIENLKKDGNDFKFGLALMNESLINLPEDKLSVSSLTDYLKNHSDNLSYEAKLGVLSFWENALYTHYNKKDFSADKADLDEVVANAALYLRGDLEEPKDLGLCRHYAALVSEVANQGLGLNSSVITSARHVLVQIKNGEDITLLDRDMVVSSLFGKPIRTKDEADAALIRMKKEPTIIDLTMDAGANKILYENRHNNFAGLFNKLSNRDNLSLRVPEFVAGSDKLDLFPHINEAGVSRGIMEKGNVGVEAYWLRNNNEYSDFLKNMKGFNVATYVPAEFSLNKTKFQNIFFANLGFYHSVLNLAEERGSEAKTLDANLSLENYLRCSLNTSLTAGLITKLADANLELARQGDDISSSQNGEYHGSLSPFVSFEVPSGKGKAGHTYLASGAQITNHLSLPNLKKVTATPWFQAGFEYDKAEIDLGLRLRGEFQNASSRFDFDSFLKKGNNQLELRAFLEMYNQQFKNLSPYQDVAGIEAGIKHDLKNGNNLFLMLSAKSEKGELKQILLNLGYKF